jgi:hypothetical protein
MKVEVEIDTIYKPERKHNHLQLTMDGATITDSEGKKAGEINNVIPVGLQIKSEYTGNIYTVKVKELFAAIIEVEENEDKKTD